MAIFQRSDLPKSKYIVSIVAAIKKGTKIKVKGGKFYLFKKTKDIDNLEKVQTDFQKYEKILDPKGKMASISMMVKTLLNLQILIKHRFQAWAVNQGIL